MRLFHFGLSALGSLQVKWGHQFSLPGHRNRTCFARIFAKFPPARFPLRLVSFSTFFCDQVSKILCALLCALLLFQFVRSAFIRCALRGPGLPRLGIFRQPLQGLPIQASIQGFCHIWAACYASLVKVIARSRSFWLRSSLSSKLILYSVMKVKVICCIGHEGQGHSCPCRARQGHVW